MIRLIFAVCLVCTGFFFSGCSLLGGFSNQTDKNSMWNRPAVLCNLPTTENLVKDAKVKGKIAVVLKYSNRSNTCLQDGYLPDPSKGVETTNYFPEGMYARNFEEIDTLIKIDSKKGKFLTTGFVEFKNVETGQSGGSRPVKIYSMITEISIIDYKTATLIAKRQFEDAGYPSVLPQGRLGRANGNNDAEFEYTVEAPNIDKVRTYLAQISDLVKRNNSVEEIKRQTLDQFSFNTFCAKPPLDKVPT